MKIRHVAPALVACAALAACEQAGQNLPFDDQSTDPVERTVSASGGTVSSGAGASVTLPAGAFAGPTTLTLTPVPAAATPSGAAAGASAFQMTPAGLQLGAPATVQLAVDRARPDAWLASVVVSTPAGPIEAGEGSVDLTSGVMTGEISTLGTVQAVIPEPGAILRATALSPGRAPAAAAGEPAAATLPTRALRGECGAPGRRCTGATVQVSPNLMGMVDTLAVVFPQVNGAIQIEGATARGALRLTAPLRVRVGGGKNAATVPSRVVAEPTAATVVTEAAGVMTLTNVRVRGESGRQSGETVQTLTVELDGGRAWVVLDHTFQATLDDGGPQEVTVAARIPLVRVQ